MGGEKKWRANEIDGLLKFDALLTFDKNLKHQQNLKKFTIPVLVLNAASNTYLILKDLAPKIKEVLGVNMPPGGTEIK